MPSPPFFAGIPDDTMLPTKQNQNQQKQQKQWKRKAPPPPLPLPSPPAAVVKKIEKQVEEEDQEQQQQELQEPPPPDQFAQHFEAIVKTAREARARLHDKLNEVLQGDERRERREKEFLLVRRFLLFSSSLLSSPARSILPRLVRLQTHTNNTTEGRYVLKTAIKEMEGTVKA